MNYNDLDPKKLAGTPKLGPTNTPKPGKKDCLLDVLGNAFKQVKGAVNEIIGDVKNAFNGAINDVKNIVQGIKDLTPCIDFKGILGGISVDGILDDIKGAIKDGIDDAINFGKGILDAAKEARAFLTCQKGTAYEREAAELDSQLSKAGDEDSASGEAKTRALFTSSTRGTSTPMSPKMRRDISNGAPAGNAYIQSSIDSAKAAAPTGIANNAVSECKNNQNLAKTGVTGIGDSLNISSYG
jgi:uncharacterized protein YjbJ (UPF0337 family)